MVERINYSKPQLLGDIVAKTAAPAKLADALFKFKDLDEGGKAHFGESMIDLVGAGVGASSVKVSVWLWVDGTAEAGVKDADGVPGWWVLAGSDPNRGQMNSGNAITGTNGLTFAEPVFRLPMGSAIYLQVSAVANLTTLKALLRQRIRG